MTDQLLQRGDVVACAGRYFVVWNASAGAIDGFPVLFGDPVRRYKVVVAGTELAAWGISELVAAVAIDETETIEAQHPLRVLRVGRCSGGLICRVVHAACRACARRAATSRPQESTKVAAALA